MVKRCDLYAGTNGNDAAPGTSSAPFQTVQQLVDRLQPGRIGCLLGGTYRGDVRIAKGGQPGSPVRLTSSPGARATIVGRLYVTDSANDVIVSNLYLDGRNDERLPSPTVNGDRVTFTHDDVTNENTAICFALGSSQLGTAVDVLIESSRIHDCGELPATNHDHGIYVASSRHAVIENNAIYDNADRGVQLYPDAQSAIVRNNGIDGNGVGVMFAGDAEQASSNNVVRNNVIADSTIRANIEAWWGAAVGSGNVAQSNGGWNGRQGNIGTQSGFVAIGNVIADPQLVDRAEKDFSLRPHSACAGTRLRSKQVGVVGS